MSKKGFKIRYKNSQWIKGMGIFLLSVFLIPANYDQRPSPHQKTQACIDCHRFNPTTATGRNKTMMIQNIDILCQKCHTKKPDLSHPSNILPKRSIPETFPLDWKGRITCVTCHYAHQNNRSNETGYLMRTETLGKAFCQNCHSDLHTIISDKEKELK